MQIGMVGLGRMGANLSRRLMRAGHEVVAFDINTGAVNALAQDGAVGVTSLDELIARLAPPRAIWLMLPHGDNTENSLQFIAQRLQRDDILIDGGNSHFHDDVRRAAQLAERGIRYLDVGTSGGVHGLERGYCLMVGGDASAFERLDPIFSTLAPGRGDIPATGSREGFDRRAEQGYLYCGPAGAGHFVKMIHNGIEYGMMQAMAEGFDILRNAGKSSLPEGHRYDFPLADVAELWRRGSVVSSWLLDLTAEALAENPTLSRFSGVVEDSGEGRWTVQAAIDEAVPAEVLTAALFARFRSRQDHTFAEKLLSAMRYKFGGHVEKPA
ncbi:6-phosphogluconate dehydrogenase (decarboxylating) [Panacagrimonas perspica]|uniref:6-phosphogluconate dehydrogenase (Decarboxylating) n=1 Tax=Panacagrimonas perspica TaxID=381431 RepID=A0A4S3K4J4_9GAMM|nr:decarboxylating 6-phosphogluconate dehydrogenase [Panacagrimonas perspica]TDU31798.1 6-phosphogluconate dehydrogenase (decarboxylating) [Panacagrimonas perspica]THD02995.1 6-phosphogluconate dehydrogenase (decarboxylating) [Panacagrimonas perspica]